MHRLALIITTIFLTASSALAHPGHVHLPGVPHPPEPATGTTGPIVIIGVALALAAVYAFKRRARR